MSIDEQPDSDQNSKSRIDQIDQQLQSLVEERIRLMPQGHWPESDANVLQRVVARNQGPLGDSALTRIFRDILTAGHSLHSPLKVAYLGPEGTYSHAATTRHFGHEVLAMAEPGIADIFHAVETGRADFGVVPVENSTEGTINHTLDLMMQTPLKICGEVRLRIQHQLLSLETDLSAIQSVHAHPQSLAQCRGWLDRHLPNAERVSESSNASAAELATRQPGIAAIAGKQAAELYSLGTLMAGIEDEKTNTTRFLVLGTHDVPPSGNDATSLLMSAPNQPGGLRRLLEPLDEAGVSMTRIESRPGRTGLWEYVFFVDVAGHQLDDTLKPVLKQLRERAPLLRVLGSYPGVRSE